MPTDLIHRCAGLLYGLLLGCLTASVHAAPTEQRLYKGQYEVFQFERPIERFAIGNTAIANFGGSDEQYAAHFEQYPNQLVIKALETGVTNLLVWLQGQRSAREYTLIVDAQPPALANKAVEAASDGELSTRPVGDKLQLEGTAQSVEALARAGRAVGVGADNRTVLDASTLGLPAQVQTDIKVVEISRTALKQAGLFLGKNTGDRAIAVSTPGTLSSVDFSDGVFTLDSATGFLPIPQAFNVIGGRANRGLLGVISALESSGFAYTLAEPSLVTLSGQTASFLAGGEFPIPVQQGQSNAISIEFKEFGVRLTLTPTILDRQRIHLKVAPEVSELDFSAGVRISGAAVPALRVRRTDTSVQLGDGESFLISGLITQVNDATVDKLPFLGEIPILGAFFRSNRTNRQDRELVMVVTPHLINPLARDAALPTLPGEDYKQYNPGAADFFFFEDGRFRDPALTGFSN